MTFFKKRENIIIGSIFIVAFIVFCSLCVVVKLNSTPSFDLAIADFAYGIRGEKYGFIYWLFRIITEFGFIYIMAMVAILMILYTGIDYRFWLLVFVVVLSRLFNTVFKSIYDRLRPDPNMWWQHESSSSFPSGHSTNVAVIFSFLLFLFHKSSFKKGVKIGGIVFCAAIIPLVMFSRIILGVHYFTDVMAGASCGLFCSLIGMLLYNLFEEKNILANPLIKFKWLIKEEKNEEEAI